MLSNSHEEALSVLLEKLGQSDILWALTGSASFFLQGMNVEVHDIDIQTDEEGAYAIESKLSDYMTKAVSFSSTDVIRSHFGVFLICGISVEVMGDIQKFHGGSWENIIELMPLIKNIDYNGLSVPVLDLHYESAAYRKLGRIDRADAIDDFLKLP